MQNCNRRYTSTGMEKSYHTRSDQFFELHKINIEKYEPDYKE